MPVDQDGCRILILVVYLLTCPTHQDVQGMMTVLTVRPVLTASAWIHVTVEQVLNALFKTIVQCALAHQVTLAIP